MSAHKSEGSGSFLLNPNALLALVTIASGWWLVAQKLSSDRPVPPAGALDGFIGDQKLEARLWEDPLKGAGGDATSVETSISSLTNQIRDRQNPGTGRTLRAVQLLPVLLAGGHYSEDQESRIRSRFAVVSALGREGYAPLDAEHIGSLRIPWLTQQEVRDATESTSGPSTTLRTLWEECPTEGVVEIHQLGIPVTSRSPHIHVRFEWYRPRTFDQGSALRAKPDVLVLWLDETHFEDLPELRLALLLGRLIGAEGPVSHGTLSISLIGPRRSSTLRSLLPKWEKRTTPLANLINCHLDSIARPILKQVDVYAATPSAMDEVLVQDVGDADWRPRESVRRLLVDTGPFRSFHNFAATDAQMAREIFEELDLRNVNLRDPDNHVVLISEWDTFYARMLALTYRAELARFGKSSFALSRADFVAKFRSTPESEDDPAIPRHLHSLVYLRGLDGQALRASAEDRSGNREAKANADKSATSLPWEPDINRAEGQAQFDYLGRLGDQIEALRQSVRKKGGALSAIGIVGSDVYDTLLILQALRSRFSEVHFFTTDLDVRYLHPREREWARNLIVASPYGLKLHDRYQGTVAPFRDAAQTAQFAATLAALGNKELAEFERIPPRRFEVGHQVAVDLSPPGCIDNHLPLHPLTKVETNRRGSDATIFYRNPVYWGLGAGMILLLGLSRFWDPLQRLTWDCTAYLRESLNYREEDMGDPENVPRILAEVDRFNDPVAKRLAEHPSLLSKRQELAALQLTLAEFNATRGAVPARSQFELDQITATRADMEGKRDRALAALQTGFIDRLNEIGNQKESEREPPVPGAPVRPYGRVRRALLAQLWTSPKATGVVRHYEKRKALDELLARAQGITTRPAVALTESGPGVRSRFAQAKAWIARRSRRLIDLVFGRTVPEARPELPGEFAERADRAARAEADQAARAASLGIFWLRCRRLLCFWISTFLFGSAAVVMFRLAWLDTYQNSTGEPFSLVSGTSAWPAEFVRLAVLALAICFCFTLVHRLREAFLVINRAYRLSDPPPDSERARNSANAEVLWREYRRESCFSRRFWVILGITVLYMAFLFAVVGMFNRDVLRPIRGDLLKWLDILLIALSVLGFLFLAFLTADAARHCRHFIEKLSRHPTQYPEATHHHFSRQLGEIDRHYIDEWIDLQLIADLTEKVDRLVYFPAALLFLLLAARNSWWDRWPWPPVLIVVFALNFAVALTSVVILQRAAKRAKAAAEKSLEAKLKRLLSQASASTVQNNAAQAEKLLEEIRSLNRGAFVPFWENPVVGAIFLSSGGTTLLQMFILLINR